MSQISTQSAERPNHLRRKFVAPSCRDRQYEMLSFQSSYERKTVEGTIRKINISK